MELRPSYTTMYLMCSYRTHFFYSPCFAWIPPIQMWHDLKNENRQNIYAPQNVKSHWLQAVHPVHFFRPSENDVINEKSIEELLE